MTLATHIVVGATAATVFTTHPVEAFLVGFASHFVLDAIPHWDYPIDSLSDERAGTDPLQKKIHFSSVIFFDVARVLLDVFVGVAIVAGIVFFRDTHILGSTVMLLIAGAFGGVLPDFLQFLNGVIKNPLLQLHQKFHHFIHARIKLDDRPIIGVPIQLGIILVVGSILSKFLVQ